MQARPAERPDGTGRLLIGDVEVCEAAGSPLSSVAMPWRHIGELAALHLHRMLGADPGGQEIRVAPRFVATRTSTAAPIPTDPLAAACLAIIEREFAGPLRKTKTRHTSI